MRIIDGQKIIVCKLHETSENRLTAIAMPVDETHLPNWFTCLPFDSDGMMVGIVDKKVENLLSVLGWDLKAASKDAEQFNLLFG
jgi:hypothetical protein